MPYVLSSHLLLFMRKQEKTQEKSQVTSHTQSSKVNADKMRKSYWFNWFQKD